MNSDVNSDEQCLKDAKNYRKNISSSTFSDNNFILVLQLFIELRRAID